MVDNVELGFIYHGLSRKERHTRALDVIEHVGLTGRRDGLCSQLSGGEKQRVAIACSLVRKPSLVLCDEPSANLDSAISEQVLQLIEDLHNTGLTVVIIIHDPVSPNALSATWSKPPPHPGRIIQSARP